jgi:hypothetical protein
MNKEKALAIATTYGRAAVAGVVALYLAGENDPKKLGYAFIAAFLGPILKALDPKATEFGKGSN